MFKRTGKGTVLIDWRFNLMLCCYPLYCTTHSGHNFLLQDKSSKSDRDKSNNKVNKSVSVNTKPSEKSEASPPSTDANIAKSKPVKKVKAKATTSLPSPGSLELPYKPKTIDDRKDKKKQRAKGESIGVWCKEAVQMVVIAGDSDILCFYPRMGIRSGPRSWCIFCQGLTISEVRISSVTSESNPWKIPYFF